MAYYIIMDFVRQCDDITVFRFFTECFKTPIIGIYPWGTLNIKGRVLRDWTL
jgi:hypothetical protein